MASIKVFTDIHGCLDELEELLAVSGYHPDRDRLVFLGDYIDRGPQSRQVVERVRGLVQSYGAVALGGNHEELFLNWLDEGEPVIPLPYSHEKVGGVETVLSYTEPYGHIGFDEQAREIIFEEYADHVAFLRGLPDFHEEAGHVFVHAGIDPTLADWKLTERKDFRWVRDKFHWAEEVPAQTVVFGHTPTPFLHKREGCSDIWFGPGRIGVDGGCVFGQRLNCLEIAEDGQYRTYSVARRK